MSLTYPEDRSYHSEHLWAKSEPDGTMLVGITDYAQDQLGGVIFVDLPAVGEHFKQGVSCASIESVKITSDAIIPVSGEIVAVNETQIAPGSAPHAQISGGGNASVFLFKITDS